MRFSTVVVPALATLAAAAPSPSVERLATLRARNELACANSGDMACAGLVTKRVAAEMQARNELACADSGDMACAGVRDHLSHPDKSPT